MNKLIIIFFSIISISGHLRSQNVGINEDGSLPNSSAMLDISSTSKGILIPNIALTNVNDAGTIPNPATSLWVYNTGTGGLTPSGFYYNSGTPAAPVWTYFSASTAWNLNGNTGTIPFSNYLGSTNDASVDFRTNNTIHVRFKNRRGQIEILNTGGSVYIVEGAGNSDISTTALPSYSTFVGNKAGFSNNGGLRNSAMGYEALYSNTIGNDNVAMGYRSLFSNTEGSNNAAIGSNALFNNTIGNKNVGFGYSSLLNNSDGNYNVAVGTEALKFNTSGSYNTAIGPQALFNNTTGNQNCALGYLSLKTLTTGTNNIGLGSFSGEGISNGTENIAIGYKTLPNATSANYNIVIGTESGSLITGDKNIVIGYKAAQTSTTGNSNITIGNNINAVNPSGSNQLNIGNIIFSNGIDGTGTTLSTGNIGIGTTNPTAKLDVAGSVKIGTNGTEIKNIIKTTVNKDIANLTSNTYRTDTFTISNAEIGSSIIVSSTPTAGIVMMYSWVSAANTVSVKFYNGSGSDWDPAAQDYYFTLIK